ncbi:MAG: protease SohB [Pseudomonadota bacterium]|nr:protease SohB [Pseudomonadota bacterium]
MEFLAEYGLFLAKTITFVVAFILVVAVIVAVGARGRKADKGHLDVKSLNKQYDRMRDALADTLLPPDERKLALKARRQRDKARRKADKGKPGKRVFVVNFHGDLRASATRALREEVTAVLAVATPMDEVVVRLESGGGMVHGYGLAASQLDRVRKAGIPLTVCIDKVAASGGYMMACVADRILAAPFAFVGSIGVVAQLPNFHRLLKKHDVDYEVLTAGEFKRTLTVFGENTEKGREKFLEDLQETHDLFKHFVQEHRPAVDIDAIATGEVWLGTPARELGLVDEVMTSDEYITAQLESAAVFEVCYLVKKSLPEKVGFAAEESVDGLAMRWLRRLSDPGQGL